jgi:hypothetical protein
MNDVSHPSPQEAEITIAQLHAYLQSKQWYEDGKIRSVATIWHRWDDVDSEILVPSLTAKDYLPRFRQALLSLSVYEKRLICSVARDIRRIFLDIITVRIIHDDTADGTIPINDGVLLITKAKELLSAAAQSVYAKRRQFTGGVPREAKEYLDTLLLGQTEVGSYIVNVISPAQPVMSVNVQTAESVPLGQVVAGNLITSLEALVRASAAYEENGNLQAFDAAVGSGASSNLCDALLGFSGEKHHREFEITVTGASIPMFESQPKKFIFDSHDVELLEKVSDYYKDDYVLLQRRVMGYITKLSRPKDQTSGTIIIDATLGDIERKVRIELSGDDYHMAILAHDKSRLVRVDGDVHIMSKSAQLLNPVNFGVIQNEDLF